jgi:His/Glu/Gln/Arg/opine family amino acid ABC transporter permease subunit
LLADDLRRQTTFMDRPEQQMAALARSRYHTRPAGLLREIAVAAVVLSGIVLPIASMINWSFARSLQFSIVFDFSAALAGGAVTTLGVTFAAVTLGLIIGVALAIAIRIPVAPLRWTIIVYVELWRNTPLLIQLFWIHFVLPILTGISTPVLVSGVIGMTLQSSAYLTEVARAGINAIPPGQWEAARSLGLSRPVLWRRVVLPQALRVMMPALANTIVSIFKASAVLTALSVGELMSISQRIADYTFKPIEVLSVVAIIYFAIGKAITSVLAAAERRLQYPG